LVREKREAKNSMTEGGPRGAKFGTKRKGWSTKTLKYMGDGLAKKTSGVQRNEYDHRAAKTQLSPGWQGRWRRREEGEEGFWGLEVMV